MSASSPIALLQAADGLSAALSGLSFATPVTHVYNPLEYARAGQAAYIEKFGHGPKRVLFLGMNPGPFGMAQTGVPFGEIQAVRQWMGLHAEIAQPARPHPKRPVEGFACQRSEVSGRRLWGWAASRFGTAESFFSECYVANYCPLVWMEESGRNRTPDKIPAREIEPVYAACDAHLRRVIAILQPEWLVGVGAFAEKKLQAVAPGNITRLTKIPHPSPASPAANKDWPGDTTRALIKAGVWKW